MRCRSRMQGLFDGRRFSIADHHPGSERLRPDRSVSFRRSRLKVLHFLEQQAKCIVEACGSYRGREKLGHEVRLLPPRQPFVKRERRGGRGRRSRVPPDVRRREDRGTAVVWNDVAGTKPGDSGPRRRFAVASSALQLRKALPTSGSLRCWRLPSYPCPCPTSLDIIHPQVPEKKPLRRVGRSRATRTWRIPFACGHPGRRPERRPLRGFSARPCGAAKSASTRSSTSENRISGGGQFPSETDAPSDDHGGGALQALGRPVLEFLAAGFQDAKIARPYHVRSASAALGSVVSRNRRSSSAGGFSSRTCTIVSSTGALHFAGRSTLR